MLCVDATERITYISASFPGSAHDARVFRCSRVPGILEAAVGDPILLGDSGYALTKNVMTPIRDPKTPAQQAYCRLLTSERALVERVIGQVRTIVCPPISVRP
jgi:hypothetical protein